MTDRLLGPGRPHEVGAAQVGFRPSSLVVGIGAAKGAPADEIVDLVRRALHDAGLSPESLGELATVDAKADEPGVVEAAGRLGVPLVTYSAEELAAVEVPNPSEAPLTTVGTPSVAEAAALVRGGELLVPKRKSEPTDGRPARVTCAVVRRTGRPATLASRDPATVEMMIVVTVGNTATREIAGRMVTPRDHRRQEKPEGAE